MKNQDIVKKVVFCRECVYRFTEKCPCRIEIKIAHYSNTLEIDQTEYDGFCWKGETK